MIILYRVLSLILFPFILIWIGVRIIKGKEEPRRIRERFGFTKAKKQAGEYIWIHAASVGESLVAINLANHLKCQYSNYNFLITTGTVTSAKLVSSRINDSMLHQYIPIDEYFSVRRFFKFWFPTIGILIESEIWPNLVTTGSEYCKLVVVNAIMSNESLRNWKKYPIFASSLFSRFSSILCQSSADAAKYRQICDNNVANIGNLKFSSPKPFVNLEELKIMKAQLSGKKVLLAASTHRGDEKIILDIFTKLRKQYNNLYLIIAIRHPSRVDEISSLVLSYGLASSIRSSTKEIGKDVYLVDTIGELGLFYGVAEVSFIGGSFNAGGHNLLEAAFFDTKIVVGPDMKNFASIAKEFLSSGAILQAIDEDDLLQKLDYCIGNEDSNDMIEKARDILSRNSKIIENYIKNIGIYLKK